MRQTIILVLLLLAACAGPDRISGAMTLAPSADAQIVRVGMDNLGYTFKPSVIDVNKPVKFIRDPSLQGCSMFMIIPEFEFAANFMKHESIMFTPTKTGTFNVMCSMNMHKGRITVK